MLELLDVLPPSYDFANGMFSVLPRAVFFPRAMTLFTLILMSVTVLITLATAVTKIRRELTDAKRRRELNAWQLRQLLPEEPAPRLRGV